MTTENDTFHTDVRRYISKMDDALEKIADALVKIARLEERHQETRESLGRMGDRMAKSDDIQAAHTVQLATISEQLKPLSEARTWIISGVLAVVGLVGVAVVGLVVVK